MSATHRAVEHHASAAIHHEQAARYHSEASRHFEVGKDFSHAAHQSLIAHGHTLQAVKRGEEARDHYAKSAPIPDMPKYPEEVVFAAGEALAIAGVPFTNINSSKHHKAAAGHHMEAARCHNDASKHCLEKDYPRAARETQLACDHAQKALARSNNAAQRRIENSAEPELKAAAE